MQRLQFVLFQMDEAKRLVREGHLPALRVALLLLDNAAEVALDRWIDADLKSDAMRQRIQSVVRKAGVPENHPDFADLFSRQFLSGKEKKQLSRYFDDKIRYVTVVKPEISPGLGSVLSHLHRYRNEAYHSARVKEDTLRTSVVILLELCCLLLHALKPATSISSLDDYSWMERRFRVKTMDMWDEAGLAGVLDDLREGLPVTDDSLRRTLAQNLSVRLEEALEELDFIVENARVKIDRVSALADAQEYTLKELQDEPPYRNVPKGLAEPVSLDHLERIRVSLEGIREAPDGIAAFAAFAEPDRELERIEYIVGRLAEAIDEMTQMEVDAARGK